MVLESRLFICETCELQYNADLNAATNILNQAKEQRFLASTVGSIGVRMDRFDVSELMRKLGIKYDPVYAGEHKTMGTPFQELSDEDRMILEDMVTKLHELFISTVASNRRMGVEKLRPLADGRVFLGKDALENGLVDYLGGRSDAAEWMYGMLHDQPFEIEVYQQSQQKGIFGITSSFGQAVGEGVGRVLIEYTVNYLTNELVGL